MMLPVYVAMLEVKRFLANRGELGFSIALPIVLFALMQGIGSGASFSGTAHVANLDEGALGEELIAAVEAIDGVDVKLYSQAKLDAAIDRSAVLTGVVIPADFSVRVEAGEPVSIVFKQRGSGGDEGQIIAQIVEGVARGMFIEYESRALAADLLSGSAATSGEIAGAIAELVGGIDGDDGAASVSDGQDDDGGDEFTGRILPGILVMFLMFAVTLSAQTIVEERSNGTLERLMMTRLGVWRLFWGKFLAGIARAMVQVVVLLGLAAVALGSFGPIAVLQAMVFSIFVAAAVSGMGLLIASVARTRDQANWAAVFVTMFMVVFGGTFFPLGDSGVLSLIGRFTVNHYAIDALESILTNGGTLATEGLGMVAMAVTAVGSLILARLTFRVSGGA